MLTLLFFYHGMLIPGPSVAGQSVESWVLSNGTLPPVTTRAGDGYLDSLYEEWFSRSGLSVELIAMPAARGLADANAGLLDGDVARVSLLRSQYPNLRKISEPVFEVDFSGFFLDSSVNVTLLADFENYRVGYVRGWKMAEAMFREHPNAISVRKAEILLDMLVEGRIDIAFLSVAPTREMARSDGVERLMTTDFRVTKEFYLYVNSKHYDKIPELTRTLREMKSDGSYDVIMSDYMLENQ